MHGPMYQQIALTLRERCARHIYLAGALLPTERELMDEFSVSRVTVRRALKELVNDNVIESRQGSGYTVKPTLRLPMNSITSFSEDCRARGLKPGSQILEHHRSECTKDEAEWMNIPEGTLIDRLHRLRTGNDLPLSVDRTHLPASIGIGSKWPQDSLYLAFVERGIEIVRVSQSYLPIIANAETAEILKVPAGTALMQASRTAFVADGLVVEVSLCCFRPDRWTFSHEIFR